MLPLSCWLPGCQTDPAVQWSRRDGADTVAAVAACGPHAIALDAAARIHQPTCAPDTAQLPACGCTPEQLPDPVTPPGQDGVTLPTGWVVQTPGEPT
jgi:hypothetical protein